MADFIDLKLVIKLSLLTNFIKSVEYIFLTDGNSSQTPFHQ